MTSTSLPHTDPGLPAPVPADPRAAHMDGRHEGTRWRLDPSASTAEFRVRSLWGLGRVRGHFDRLDGSLDVDESGERRMRLSIEANSLDTGNRKRDRHLRSADFFDAEHHPEVRFHSTAVTDRGDGRLCVHGELEAAGRCVALELEPAVERTGDELEIRADTTVDQRRLGMTASLLGMTRAPATLAVRARLRRVAS